MAVNKAILVGNLGSAPEFRRVPGLNPVCTFRVATDHKFQDSAGNRKSRTEWHRVVCFGATAESCAKHLAKGRQVYVEGHIHTEKWNDSKGVARLSTRIVARQVQFLGPHSGSSEGGEDIDDSDLA
jgi:single-strand DNA-binding protein